MLKYDFSESDQSLKITMDFNNMMSDIVGERGIKKEEIRDLTGQFENAFNSIKKMREEGNLEWAELPYTQTEVVEDILTYVEQVKDDFDNFVVFGIGGSALGPISVQQAINHPHYNELSREKRNGFPKLYVADNIDPEKLAYLFDVIDLEKSLFNVVSKSGSTSETMSQFMIIKTLLEEKLGVEQAKKHIVCTTDAETGNLIKIAKDEGYKTFIIPSAVGGRFSELSPVGLVSAAFTGVDIKQLLKGAAFIDTLCSSSNIHENPALMYAVLNYISMKKGKNICVMMPYADSLKFISDWYCQLWAESLGKKYDLDGKEVFAGTTPVKALGVTDQHSQVQLYTEGPFDKIVVFLSVNEFKETITIPKIYGDMPSLGFLGGTTQNKLLKTEQMATEYALLKSERANMTIELQKVNEFTLGQLLYFFEMATAYAGALLNINTFDQPGVEEGKNATYAMFGRPGYEDKKKELDARPAKKTDYII